MVFVVCGGEQGPCVSVLNKELLLEATRGQKPLRFRGEVNSHLRSFKADRLYMALSGSLATLEPFQPLHTELQTPLGPKPSKKRYRLYLGLSGSLAAFVLFRIMHIYIERERLSMALSAS